MLKFGAYSIQHESQPYCHCPGGARMENKSPTQVRIEHFYNIKMASCYLLSFGVYSPAQFKGER